MRTVGEVAALGLSLADVAAVVNDPTHDRLQVLRDQAERLRDERDRLGDLLDAVEDAIAAADRGERQQEGAMFDGADHEAHAREAEERWGDTDAWRQSQRRTSRYGEAEWDVIRAEADANEAAFATLLRDGVAATDDRAAPLVVAHRRHIDRWFYDCGPGMQRNLAAMYVADPRFAAHYDDREPGLAQFVHDAIQHHTEG